MKAPAKPKVTAVQRAGIYVRLSRDRDGETSTKRQEAEARAFAKSRDYKVVEVYTDLDVSGYKKVARPAFDRMIDDVRAGELDVVIVWKVDRITRQGLAAIGRILDALEDGGATLVSVTEGIDTSTAIGEMILGILAGVARSESENIGLRVKSAKAYEAAQGFPNGGGRRPLGYTNAKFEEVVPEEAELLREARDRVLGGESLRSITIDWNERGLRSPYGVPFHPATLGRTIRSAHLAALREHNGAKVPGTWEPIFTVEEHEALTKTAGVQRPAAVDRRLLTGYLICCGCGSNLRFQTTKRFGRRYMCYVRGCGKVALAAHTIEEFVVEAVLYRLDSPDVRAALIAESRNAADQRLAIKLEADRDALAQLSRDHYVERVISREEFLAARQPLEEAITAAEARLARQRTGVSLPKAGAIREAWDTADLDRQRELIGAVVQRIVVNPTPVRGRGKFDPERLDWEWRA